VEALCVITRLAARVLANEQARLKATFKKAYKQQKATKQILLEEEHAIEAAMRRWKNGVRNYGHVDGSRNS